MKVLHLKINSQISAFYNPSLYVVCHYVIHNTSVYIVYERYTYLIRGENMKYTCGIVEWFECSRVRGESQMKEGRRNHLHRRISPIHNVPMHPVCLNGTWSSMQQNITSTADCYLPLDVMFVLLVLIPADTTSVSILLFFVKIHGKYSMRHTGGHI